MSNYPDNANFTAMEAQAPRYLSRDADADLATLDTLKRRIAALTEMLNAWTPCTTQGQDAQGDAAVHLTNLLDDLGMYERAIAAREGVRL